MLEESRGYRVLIGKEREIRPRLGQRALEGGALQQALEIGAEAWMRAVERGHDPGIEEGGRGGAVGDREAFPSGKAPVPEVAFGKIIGGRERRLRIGDAAPSFSPEARSVSVTIFCIGTWT